MKVGFQNIDFLSSCGCCTFGATTLKPHVMKTRLLFILCALLVGNWHTNAQTLTEIPSPAGYENSGNGYQGEEVEYNGKLYIRMKSNGYNGVLFEYDGTTLTEIPSPVGFTGNNKGYKGFAFEHGSDLYVQYQGDDNNYDLFKFDGSILTEIPSPAGFTGSYDGYDPGNPSPISFGSDLYLKYKHDDGYGVLFKYDGTTLTEIPTPTGYTASNAGYIGYPVVLGSELLLIYTANDFSKHLFKYDGTNLTAVTEPSGYDQNGFNNDPIIIGSNLYMKYLKNNGVYNLMKYDGTTMTEVPSPTGFDAQYQGYDGKPFVWGSDLYLRYNANGANGYHLFKYDGTSLTQIASPTGYNSEDNSGYYGDAIAYDNKLYLRYLADGTGPSTLFSYDGTTLTEIPALTGYGNDNAGYAGGDKEIVVGGYLYLAYYNPIGNVTLMKYDGSTFTPIPSPTGFAAAYKGYNGLPVTIGSTLFVRYKGDDNNYDLFKYDGTTLTEIPSPVGFIDSNDGYYGNPIVSGSTLYMRYSGNDGNFDLFKYDQPCDETTSSFTVSACESYTVPSGDETYITSQQVMDTIPNVNGCDSVMTIDVTILQPTVSSFAVSACEEYTVPSGDETYTTSQQVMDTIPSLVNGCDSVMTIDVTILQPTVSSYAVSVCETYTVPSGDETYSSSQQVMDTIPSLVNGCDSVMTIDVTILQPTFNQFSVTACDEYTVPSGDETYTVSDTYMDTIPNVAGCDSVMTIDVTIDNGCIFPAGGLNFDGTDDHVVIPDTSSYNFGTESFTIEVWIRTSSTDFQIITQKRPGDNQGSWFRLALSVGRPFLEINPNSNITAVNSIADGSWHHVAAVRNSSAPPKIYVDGVEVTATINGNWGAFITNADDIDIGSNLGSCCFFNGDMDELRFWTEARSAGDILAYMNCPLWGISSELLGYFKFDHGYINEDNSSVTELEDITGNENHGALNNFALVGTTSNWSEGQPNCLTVDVAQEESEVEQFILYPNPTIEVVNVEFTGGNYRMTMFDMTGKIVVQQNMTDMNSKVDVSDFSKGIYSIRFETEDGSIETHRLVKQ